MKDLIWIAQLNQYSIAFGILAASIGYYLGSREKYTQAMFWTATVGTISCIAHYGYGLW